MVGDGTGEARGCWAKGCVCQPRRMVLCPAGGGELRIRAITWLQPRRAGRVHLRGWEATVRPLAEQSVEVASPFPLPSTPS